MTTPNPATPAQAATPGEAPNSPATPAATPAPTGDHGGQNQEGKVTISTKEFAQLQRDAARGKSKDRRDNLNLRRNQPPAGSNENPDINAAIDDANKRAEEAEQKALKVQVQGRVRELLDKDEYKNIPKSTRELILTSPHLLSQADNLEEAILDIEDFLIDKVLPFDIAPANTPAPSNQPAGHETPPALGSGAPAPAGGADMEDTTKLSGPAKSQAMIRNSIRKNKK